MRSLSPELVLELAEKVDKGDVSASTALNCLVIAAKNALDRRKEFMLRKLAEMEANDA